MLHNDPLICMRKDPEWVRIIRAILLRIWAFVTGHLLFLYEKKEYIEPCKKKKRALLLMHLILRFQLHLIICCQITTAFALYCMV